MNFIEVSALFDDDTIVQKIYSSSKRFTPSVIRKCEGRLTARIEKLSGSKTVNVFTRLVDEPKVVDVPEELFNFK